MITTEQVQADALETAQLLLTEARAGGAPGTVSEKVGAAQACVAIHQMLAQK